MGYGIAGLGGRHRFRRVVRTAQGSRLAADGNKAKHAVYSGALLSDAGATGQGPYRPSHLPIPSLTLPLPIGGDSCYMGPSQGA